MKIDGRTVTPNELAKIEILRQLEIVLFDGLEQCDTIDGRKYTEREEDAVFEQLSKRHQSIRNLLGADKLNEKFKLNL